MLPPRVLLVSGSLRKASTSTAALRTLAMVGASRATVSLYEGLRDLAPFSPDDDSSPPESARTARALVRAADAVMFSTPEYAGALPGAFKNLLDWCIGDAEAGSIYGKPVAVLRVSADRGHRANDELRTVLGFAGARIVEEACAVVPVSGAMVRADGSIDDHQTRAALLRALEVLVADVRQRQRHDGGALPGAAPGAAPTA